MLNRGPDNIVYCSYTVQGKRAWRVESHVMFSNHLSFRNTPPSMLYRQLHKREIKLRIVITVQLHIERVEEEHVRESRFHFLIFPPFMV